MREMKRGKKRSDTLQREESKGIPQLDSSDSVKGEKKRVARRRSGKKGRKEKDRYIVVLSQYSRVTPVREKVEAAKRRGKNHRVCLFLPVFTPERKEGTS